VDDLAEELVAAIDALRPPVAGRRAVHSKGVCAAGTFQATPEAAALCRAAHLQGEPVAATVRFSNGAGGEPAHDGVRDGRGMATTFHLPDGTRTDIVALTLPVFFARTAEDFLDFTRARRPDPATGGPDPAVVGAYLAAHPEASAAVALALNTPPPASYAQLAYYGIHAFRLLDSTGHGRFVRYQWAPAAGEAKLADAEALARPPDYLEVELAERLAGGGLAFSLLFQLAADDDPTDDPTAAWPADRPVVLAGQLELSERVGPSPCERLVFDPTRVTDGIECSADPILRVRSAAYSISIGRRLAGG
jgi:catalase